TRAVRSDSPESAHTPFTSARGRFRITTGAGGTSRLGSERPGVGRAAGSARLGADVDTPALQAEFAGRLRQDQTRLYGYIHALVRDLNDADDLYQQTALILWKKFAEFDRSRSFFAWACGIARLEAASFLRSRSRQRLYFSDDLSLLLVEAQEEL